MSFSFTGPLRAAALSLFALALLAPTAAAQKPAAGKPAQARPWSVRVSKAAPYTFTVKAADASLAEVAAEISRLSKVPVTLSPVMQKQRVTLDFGGLNLDATLRMLAPQPVVDYEAGGDDPQPRPLAIYLQALNERPPAPSAEVRGNTEAILIEGDTEEGTAEADERRKKDEEVLKVTYANNQLSVRAKRQPLSVVLFKVASEVGVPFDLRHDVPQVIDVEFDNYPLEQALRTLSPAVRFYYRQDLQTLQIKPLRLALVPQAAASS
jgi:hypothetical protein